MDPELRPGLAVYESVGFAEQDLSVEVIRAMRARFTELFAAAVADLPPNDGVTRVDRHVPGPEGAPDVLVRIYRPVEATQGLPCLVWIHGGGTIFGNVDQDDSLCETYAERAGCVVVSVEYRLAPEHPYPAAVEDCHAALRWTAGAADELDIDRQRIAVGGTSAGAGLTVGTLLLARDRGGPAVSFQLLTAPMLDDRNSTPSAVEFREILSWSHAHNRSGWAALLGDKAGGEDVPIYAAPARATDLAGLPPALVQVGELDVVRDEGVEYAVRLLRAGVSTELHVYPGAYHGWDTVAPHAAASVRALDERVRALCNALHPGTTVVAVPA